ncbi:outer membrane protein assembly factor BamB family protein [Lignipirellula cremea]|uniref:Outer membrane biogenesis protein BamB n=1 Tax=Lignipirellula cremea TaxID=2528010 RepID=A0A518E3K1_9BACT|nr:PQQ-binding-like beta-propeller repeat protein [Lignipirellula cremea]QDU98664.1 outer membrane biogenesis protein BamB [Lignipirellula cremea]
MIRYAWLFCLLLPCAASAEQPNWNQFRGPAGDGHATAVNLPVELSETKNLVWKTAIRGKAWSSPVAWGDQIWLTTAPEDGKQLSLLCVDFKTGEIIKDIVVFDNPDPAFCHGMNSYATPTPVIEEGRIYVHYGSAGTAAVDTASGEVLWTRRDLPCDHFRGAASSPIVFEDLLIIPFDGFDVQYVAALNKKDGTTAWKTPRTFDFGTKNGDNKKAYCTPAVFEVNGSPQLVCPAAVATETLDPRTGKLLWTVFHGGMNASARPLYGEGLIFITNGMGRMVAAAPPAAGSDEAEVAWESSKGVPKKASLLLIDGLLYMAADTGVVSCVEPKTGDVIWSERLVKEYAASPLYADGRIYLFGREGEIHVLQPGREFKLLAETKLANGFMASPAVVDDSILVRSTSDLYRFEKP